MATARTPDAGKELQALSEAAIPPITKAEVHAIKALVRGEADQDQQKRAMDWIITQACRFYEPSFGATMSDTNHAEGRRFVGWLIVKISNMRIIRRQEENREQG